VTDAVFIASALLAGAAGLLVGLRWKHRRFIDERTKRLALESRMDAYRLADTRTDLDTIGPVTGEHSEVQLNREHDEDLADLVLTVSRMATDNGRRIPLDEVMAEHGITQEELDALPDPDVDDATWTRAYHLQVAQNRQAPDPQDDTGTGTIAHLHSGEWAPAAPAPKQVGR
jgi:hypothetical protein